MRFYLSDFTGDGLLPETAWNPRIKSLQSSPIKWIDGRLPPTGDKNGLCLAYTDNTDAEHLIVKADPNITYAPFESTAGDVLNLTDTVGDMDATKKANIIAFLESKHIPTQGLTNASTIKEVVESIVKRFILRANLRGLDLSGGLDTNISSIPASQRQAIASQLQLKGFDTSGLSGTVRQALKALMAQDIRAMQVNI